MIRPKITKQLTEITDLSTISETSPKKTGSLHIWRDDKWLRLSHLFDPGSTHFLLKHDSGPRFIKLVHYEILNDINILPHHGMRDIMIYHHVSWFIIICHDLSLISGWIIMIYHDLCMLCLQQHSPARPHQSRSEPGCSSRTPEGMTGWWWGRHINGSLQRGKLLC